MHPGVAFMVYLAVGCVLILMFLLLCVRISVFIEDTCPIRFCLRRKQRKLRKILIRDMLFPDERVTDPESSPRPAPPSDENITADIICQPYIYRDAYSTGLTELSGLSYLANLPLTVSLSDGNPSDAVVTNYNSGEPMRVMRYAVHHRSLPQTLPENEVSTSNRNSPNLVEPSQEDSISATSNNEDDVQSLPPDYLNATNILNSNRSYTGIDSINLNDEAPPPSYYECVRTNKNEENGNLTNLCA